DSTRKRSRRRCDQQLRELLDLGSGKEPKQEQPSSEGVLRRRWCASAQASAHQLEATRLPSVPDLRERARARHDQTHLAREWARRGHVLKDLKDHLMVART